MQPTCQATSRVQRDLHKRCQTLGDPHLQADAAMFQSRMGVVWKRRCLPRAEGDGKGSTGTVWHRHRSQGLGQGMHQEVVKEQGRPHLLGGESLGKGPGTIWRAIGCL